MKHITFAESDSYPVAVLLKHTAFNKQDIESNYITTLEANGVTKGDVVAITLKYDANGKASATIIKNYLAELLEALQSVGSTHLYVTDSAYFKVLTKQTKAEPHLGYALPCQIKGYDHMTVVLGVNYQALIYNPELVNKMNTGLVTIAKSLDGTYVPVGNNVIHSAYYPPLADIKAALAGLHQHETLTADIEAFSLKFNEAGIGSIAFAWDQHNGLAFPCDYYDLTQTDQVGLGVQYANPEVRVLLRKFFTEYKGTLIWHNASYDLKVIIYTLWMKNALDTEGLLTGLEVMTRHFQDTKIITYLATNTTAGNVLGLKALAQEFAGNWAQSDIKDIRKIPLKDLLQYNLVDCLSTWYVYNKYTPKMQQDKQEDLYHSLMLPSLKTIIQMELTGMPLNPTKVQEARNKLEAIVEGHIDVLTNSPVIKLMNLLVQNNAMVAANAKLKVKQHPLEKFSDVKFNPNSGPQLQILLYEQMGLPVLDYTDTKQPATGADTIEKLINHTVEPGYKAILSALIGYGQANKILTTFIPAFEAAIDKGDGIAWLHGNFNLGGTVSGRLSSSEPNLTNLPAGSVYGKLIKECFVAPSGWLLVGADFSSLEDMISALTTKDTNKLKVYLDGYCGHCLRAYSYFKDELPEVRQATANERCFSIEVNGQLLLCKSGDFVKLESGETILIEDYFDTYS